MMRGDFNSHAHVERDPPSTNKSPLLTISTHTLTWSVTSAGEDIQAALCISTHTLTWSVTEDRALEVLEEANFNSHAHVERD